MPVFAGGMRMRRKLILTVSLFSAGIIAASLSCNPDRIDYEDQVEVTVTQDKDYGDIDALSRDSYRIDLKRIDLTIDYHPRQFYIDARAELRFAMYRDQTKPILHLDPVVEDASRLQSLQLNGQELDPITDWTIIDGVDSEQQAIEIQRPLSAGRDHTLILTYRKPLSQSYYMLNSQVSDLYGRSNESFFPTINRFGDLIHHRIHFRVHGDLAFRCLGSGRITPLNEPGVQAWQLDSLREIPSNTVMFLLVPQQDTVEVNRIVSGMKVRLVAFQGGAAIDQGLAVLTPWLAELQDRFGPFPMPEGYSVFLMSGGGGMEYYGGTISSLSALTHETFHMYIGTSLLLASYRDSWIDEAINEWYEHSALGNLSPIADSFASNMVSGFSPVGIGFDRRAYSEGAQIMEHISQSMGGRTAMIAFLGQLCDRYAFKPFTTVQFLDYLEQYSGLDYRSRFEQWLFSGETVHFRNSIDTPENDREKVDTTPPAEILARYPELGRGEGK